MTSFSTPAAGSPEQVQRPRVRRDTGAPRADLPSFTRALFLGDIHHQFVFPFPDPLDKRNPAEASLVRRLIADLRRIANQMIDPAKIDEDEAIPEEVLRALAGIGLFGISIPVRYGGLGLSSTAYGRVFSA